MDARLAIESYAGGHGFCNVYALDDGTFLAVSVFDEPYPNGGTEAFACNETGHVAVLDPILQTHELLTHEEALALLGHERVD